MCGSSYAFGNVSKTSTAHASSSVITTNIVFSVW